MALPVDVLLEKLRPKDAGTWQNTLVPVTFSVPLAEGAVSEVGGRPALSLTGGPTIWQSRTLAKWDDGSVKWAIFRVIASPGATNQVTVGSSMTAGVSAGSNLITQVTDTYTINTGAGGVIATVRKGALGFNLFHAVAIGGTSIVAAGSSAGVVGRNFDDDDDIVVMASPTGAIEENGPAHAVLRIDGGLAESLAPSVSIAEFSCRFYVSAGSPDIQVTFTVRNALAARDAHIQLGWLELVTKITTGATNRLVVCCRPPTAEPTDPTEAITALGSGVDDVYCFQKQSLASAEGSDADEASNYKPHIAVHDVGPGGEYNERGWTRFEDDVAVPADDFDDSPGDYPRNGYLNLSGSAAGCTIAIRQMQYFYPASLGANVDGTLRVGLWTRYLSKAASPAGSPRSYVFPWRMHESRTCCFSFHTGNVGSISDQTKLPNQVSKRLDFPSYGRLKDYFEYDNARVFPYRLVPKSIQQAIYNLIFPKNDDVPAYPGYKHVCTIANTNLTITRFRNAQQAGGDNNKPFAEQRLCDEWLRHGCGGSLFRGLDEAVYLAEWATKRSDDATAEGSYPEVASNEETLPHTKATFDADNNEHRYDENMLWAYYLTGDERLKLALFDEAAILIANVAELSWQQERTTYLWLRAAAYVADFVDEWDSDLGDDLVAELKANFQTFSDRVVDIDTEDTGAGWESDEPGGERGYYCNDVQLDGDTDKFNDDWPGTHAPVGGQTSKAVLTSSVFADIWADGELVVNRTITIDAGPGSPATVKVTTYDGTNDVHVTPALAVLPTGATTFTVIKEHFVTRGFWTARLGVISLMIVEKYLTTADAHGLLARGRKLDIVNYSAHELVRQNLGVLPGDEMYQMWCLAYAYQAQLQMAGFPQDAGGFQVPDEHCVTEVGAEGWRATADIFYLQIALAHIKAFAAKGWNSSDPQSGNLSDLDSGLEFQDYFNLYLDDPEGDHYSTDPGDPGGFDPDPGGPGHDPGGIDPSDPGAVDPGGVGHPGGGGDPGDPGTVGGDDPDPDPDPDPPAPNTSLFPKGIRPSW